MKKLIALLFLISIAMAATYSPQVSFEDPDGSSTADVVFRTGLSFTTNLTCTVLGGKVISGTPCSGSTPATVCVGTTMEVRPTVQSRWGTGTFHLASPYPLYSSDSSYYCPDSGGRYCPQMEDFTGSHSIANINWLTPSLYSEYQPPNGHAEGLTFDGSYGISLYNELGKFPTLQPVDYRRETEKPPYTNKKGYADVFCNGVYTFAANGVQQDQQDMPVQSGIVYKRYFVSTGTQRLTASVGSIKCFAGIVKYPKDVANPLWFNLYLFGHNTPNFQTVQEEETINVVNIQPKVVVVNTTLIAKNGGNYLIETRLRNTGDVRVRVDSVKPLLSGAFANPASDSACGTWFPAISSQYCSDNTNGYMQYFGTNGTEKKIYTIYTYTGSLTGAIMQLNYSSSDPTCSDATSWLLTASAPVIPSENCSTNESLCTCIERPDLARCQTNITPYCMVTPASYIVNPFEVHEWRVACFNASNKSTSCVGSNWAWAGGITGDFITRTNTNSLAYADNSNHLNGTIVYTSGAMNCHANVEVDRRASPFLHCDLTPSSANLLINDTQKFNLSCVLETGSGATNVTPTSADYNNRDGLVGTLTPDANPVKGVTFTATDESTGKVRSIGWYTDPSDPTLRGAVDFSDVTVGIPPINFTCPENYTLNCTTVTTQGPFGPITMPLCFCISNETKGNDTNNTTTEPDNSSCKLFPDPLFAFPGYGRTVTIKCGDSLNESCSGVDWGRPSGPATINLGSDPDTSVQVRIDSSAKAGDDVTISAVVNAGTDIEASCELKPIIGSADCLRLS